MLKIKQTKMRKTRLKKRKTKMRKTNKARLKKTKMRNRRTRMRGGVRIKQGDEVTLRDRNIDFLTQLPGEIKAPPSNRIYVVTGTQRNRIPPFTKYLVVTPAPINTGAPIAGDAAFYKILPANVNIVERPVLALSGQSSSTHLTEKMDL